MTKGSVPRFTTAVIAVVVLATIAAAASATQPSPGPYWTGDFRSGDFCQYATVFQSTTVNPNMSSRGYMPACPQYTPYARDPGQRVHLTMRPAPPAQAASRWVSHQQLRNTDGPWFPGILTDKATIRLTTEQTLNGDFRGNSVHWFRVSLYLPNPGFNWPASSWYTLMDLHNSVLDPAGHDWPSLSLIVTQGGNRRYLAFVLDGVTARSNYEVVRLLQLTASDRSRIVAVPKPRPKQGRPPPSRFRPFNRWHTLILGVKFSDQGTIGNSPGWARVYFDGKLVYNRARPTVWANETGVWLQLQNYKYHDAAFVDDASSSTIYFADARIGYTLSSVNR